MDRRAALGTIGGSVVGTSAVALAGCLSRVGLGSESAGVVLTRLSIENYTRSSHEVALEVDSDDDTVVSGTYDIGPREGNVLGGQLIDADLPTEPSEVVVRAEVPKETAKLDLAEQYEEACSKVIVFVERNGTLSILSSNEGTECFEETPSETGAAGKE